MQKIETLTPDFRGMLSFKRRIQTLSQVPGLHMKYTVVPEKAVLNNVCSCNQLVNGTKFCREICSSLEITPIFLKAFFQSLPASEQNHRITEQLRLEVTSGSHWVHPPCSSRATQSQFPRTMSRWLLYMPRDRNSTTSPGNLFYCSVTLTVKEHFRMFRWSLRYFSLCPFPLEQLGQMALLFHTGFYSLKYKKSFNFLSFQLKGIHF